VFDLGAFGEHFGANFDTCVVTAKHGRRISVFTWATVKDLEDEKRRVQEKLSRFYKIGK
jgi:hypothetical protein